MKTWRLVGMTLLLTLLLSAAASARSDNPRIVYVNGIGSDGTSGADFSILAPRGWVPTLTSQNTGKQGLAPGWTYSAQGARLQRGKLLIQVEGCFSGDLETPKAQPVGAEIKDFTGKAFTRRRAATIQSEMREAGVPVGPPKKLSPSTWLIGATSQSPDLIVRAINGGGCVLIGPARGERGRWAQVPTSVLVKLGRNFHGWYGRNAPGSIRSPSLLGRKILAKARDYSDSHPVHVDYNDGASGKLRGYERDTFNGYRYWDSWVVGVNPYDLIPDVSVAGLPGHYMSKPVPDPNADPEAPPDPNCWTPFDATSQPGQIMLDIDRWVVPRNDDHWVLKWDTPKPLGSGQQEISWQGYWNSGSAVVTTDKPIRLISAKVSVILPWDRGRGVFFDAQFSYPTYIQKLSTPSC